MQYPLPSRKPSLGETCATSIMDIQTAKTQIVNEIFADGANRNTRLN